MHHPLPLRGRPARPAGGAGEGVDSFFLTLFNKQYHPKWVNRPRMCNGTFEIDSFSD